MREAVSTLESMVSSPWFERPSSSGPDNSGPAFVPEAKPDEASIGKADGKLPSLQPDVEAMRNKRPDTEHTLSYDVYRRLPKRKVSALAYSETPERRFVIINSQKMVEEESTKQGLVIVDNGVIFSFQGHRFFKKLIP